MGKLTLPLDVYITRAAAYDLLLGADWLFAAQAVIKIPERHISFRLGSQSYDTVPLRCGPLRKQVLTTRLNPQYFLFPTEEEMPRLIDSEYESDSSSEWGDTDLESLEDFEEPLL